MKALISFLLSPLAAIIYGGVIVQYWHWFVMPMFDVKPIRLPIAIGLIYLVRFMTYFPSWAKSKFESETQEWVAHIIFVFFYPLMAWIYGWIVHLFV